MNLYKRQRKQLTLFALGVVLTAGCATTRIITTPDCADAVNVVSDTTVYHYFWGLVKAADIDPKCDERYNYLNKVSIESRPGNTLLTIITLGIVVPQTVSWCCAPPPGNPGHLGDPPN